MSEVSIEAALPDLAVAVRVDDDEVLIEMGLDDDLVVVLGFPNTEQPVDRDRLALLFHLAGQAWPQILNQMEAP